MASDQFNVNIRIVGTNEQQVNATIAANMAAVEAVRSSAHTAAHVNDMQRAANNAAHAAGRNLGYRGSFPAYAQRRGPDGAAVFDAAGAPVMDRAGSFDVNVRGRTHQSRILDRAQVSASIYDIAAQQARNASEAAQMGININDPMDTRWRSAAIDRRLNNARADLDSPDSAKGVSVARKWTMQHTRAINREADLHIQGEKRDELVARLGPARAGIDVAQASTRIQRIITQTDALQARLAIATREELANRIGKRDLSLLQKGVQTIETEHRRQDKTGAAALAREQARRDREERADRRQASLFSTAGTVAGMHALSTGVVNVAGQVMSGNLMQVPGTLLNAGGSWLQRTGAGQMAAARTAMASSAATGTGAGGGGGGGGMFSGVGSMAGLAGGGLALVGTAVMALGKIITGGLERGYKNSETADRFMADAEPYFDRQAREYNVANGSYATRGYNGARFIDGGKVTGYDGAAARTKYAGIVDRLGEGGLKYVPRQRQAGDRHEVGYQDDISGLGIAPDDEARVRYALKREQLRIHKGDSLHVDSEITALRKAVQQAKGSNDPAARKQADQLKANMVAKLTKYGDPGHATREDQEGRAVNSLSSLYALSAMGMGPAEAFKAYQGFRGGRGNARGSISEDVKAMMDAMKSGLPMDLQSSAMRLTDIVGGAAHAPAAMARSLARRGVIGDPQHKVIGSVYQQMADEEARGFTPNVNVAANSMDVMLGEGTRYSTVPRVRQTISEMVQSNANPLKEAGLSMIKHMLKVNSFAKGRNLKEAQLYEHETDPMVQMAEMMAVMQEGDARDLMMSALSPTESKQLEKAMKKMGGRDLKAAPEDNKELQNDESIFDRWRAMVLPGWNLIGKHRNVEAIEASSKFTSALDEAANALRSAADVGLTLASKFTFAGDD